MEEDRTDELKGVVQESGRKMEEEQLQEVRGKTGIYDTDKASEL